MLTHKEVWQGIDQLAARHQLSASGLAKRAGLDPTTFNKSKRATKLGKPRWPSTESLAKILDATTTAMSEFVQLMQVDGTGKSRRNTQRLRSIAMRDLRGSDMVDASGYPRGTGWDEVEFPLIDDDHAYAVEIDQDDMGPACRSGDVVIVSPSSSIRRTDRVLVRLATGDIAGGTLSRRSAQRVVLRPFTGGDELALSVAEVVWMARIVWISQ